MIDVLEHRALGVPAAARGNEESADLAGMLSEMDTRLRQLAHELDAVALPIAGAARVRPGTRAPAPPRTREPRTPRGEAPAAGRAGATRRITAVARGSAGAVPAARPPRPAPARPFTGHAVVRQAILEAEEDTRRV